MLDQLVQAEQGQNLPGDAVADPTCDMAAPLSRTSYSVRIAVDGRRSVEAKRYERSQKFVQRQRLREEVEQARGVFDCETATLTQVGGCRMGGVADEKASPAIPVFVGAPITRSAVSR